MYASIIDLESDHELHLLRDGKTRSTAGSIVSSLYHLKDTEGKSGAFFIFPDLSVRMEGVYKLKFTLYEIKDNEVFYCSSINSEPYSVFPAKRFPGMEESTPLSKVFAEQGLKIRIRKEVRLKGVKKRTIGVAQDEQEIESYENSLADSKRNGHNFHDGQHTRTPSKTEVPSPYKSERPDLTLDSWPDQHDKNGNERPREESSTAYRANPYQQSPSEPAYHQEGTRSRYQSYRHRPFPASIEEASEQIQGHRRDSLKQPDSPRSMAIKAVNEKSSLYATNEQPPYPPERQAHTYPAAPYYGRPPPPSYPQSYYPPYGYGYAPYGYPYPYPPHAPPVGYHTGSVPPVDPNMYRPPESYQEDEARKKAKLDAEPDKYDRGYPTYDPRPPYGYAPPPYHHPPYYSYPPYTPYPAPYYPPPIRPAARPTNYPYSNPPYPGEPVHTPPYPTRSPNSGRSSPKPAETAEQSQPNGSETYLTPAPPPPVESYPRYQYYRNGGHSGEAESERAPAKREPDPTP
ncbi:velvet factor-domain-containing protein [Globomyces pollinis-pini]|nr:velvet factor-domain-containing protein [Globomyces pollinis-pini]